MFSHAPPDGELHDAVGRYGNRKRGIFVLAVTDAKVCEIRCGSSPQARIASGRKYRNRTTPVADGIESTFTAPPVHGELQILEHFLVASLAATLPSVRRAASTPPPQASHPEGRAIPLRPKCSRRRYVSLTA